MASSSAIVRVEKATSDLLIGPDWTMNMEICDSINSDHWQAKDVVKAVKKRLQHKNPRVQFLALTLLETMMKNCGDSVHFQVVDCDILQEMVKIVKKKETYLAGVATNLGDIFNTSTIGCCSYLFSMIAVEEKLCREREGSGVYGCYDASEGDPWHVNQMQTGSLPQGILLLTLSSAAVSDIYAACCFSDAATTVYSVLVEVSAETPGPLVLLIFQLLEAIVIITQVVMIMDMQVRGKILVLLDSWREAFGGPGRKYPQYYWAYSELRQYGIQFPQRTADAVPIFTPPVTHPVHTHPPVGYGMPSNSSIRLEEAMSSEMGNLSLSDLDSIRRVMELLIDMLQAVNANDRMAVKDDVIVDLVGQCRSNQKKLMHLVNSTGDEELLGKGLALNDSLQMLLAKHDAIASGSPLPSEGNSSVPSPNTPTIPVIVASKHSDDEDEDDGFFQLAGRSCRNERPHAMPSQSSVSASGPEFLSDKSIMTVASTVTATSSTAESLGLALPDPPASVRTSAKEQDMIDLLSITLSSNPSPPHTPLTPPSVSSSGSHVPFSPSTPGYLYNSQPNPVNSGFNPQLNPVNHGFIPYSTYVVPWAQHAPPKPQLQPQPQPQPEFQPQPQPQPQPQQQPQPEFQPQLQSQRQPQVQFQPQSQPQLQPQPGLHPHFQSLQPQIPQYSLRCPPPPWASQESAATINSPSTIHQAASSHASSAAMNIPTQSFRPMQQSYSFGRGNNVPTIGETRVNANPRQTAPAASAKPFIPSYRLFEDLVDLRNPSGGLKTGGLPPNLSGSSSQNMVGRK